MSSSEHRSNHMQPERVLRFEVPGRDILEEMASAPLPGGLTQLSSDVRFSRVVFFDSTTGDLENKGATVRLSINDQGRQILGVDVREQLTEEGGVIRRHNPR
jgi:hypothetical protein